MTSTPHDAAHPEPDSGPTGPTANPGLDPHPDPDRGPRALFDFVAYSARLREVARHNDATPGRKESVAEHSWHVALVSWVLHAEFERESGLTLDLPRMLKLALMHDLVEIDAGDPSAWTTTDGAAAERKARREEAVARERFGALPAPLGPELLALHREYEAATTPEARLVRGVDRLDPALMRLLTGQGWQDVGADAAALDALQLPRLTTSPTLVTLYEEVKQAAVARGLLSP